MMDAWAVILAMGIFIEFPFRWIAPKIRRTSRQLSNNPPKQPHRAIFPLRAPLESPNSIRCRRAIPQLDNFPIRMNSVCRPIPPPLIHPNRSMEFRRLCRMDSRKCHPHQLLCLLTIQGICIMHPHPTNNPFNNNNNNIQPLKTLNMLLRNWI